MSRTTIVMDDAVQEEAKELGINVSAVCRDAVVAAIAAMKETRRAGDGFEQVVAWRADRHGDLEEKVTFTGKFVHQEGDRYYYYITAKGRVAVVDERGLGPILAAVLDDLSELKPGPAYQALADALGQVVEPTHLDI